MPYITKAPLQNTCDETFIVAPVKNMAKSQVVKDVDVIIAGDNHEETACFTARKIIDEVIAISSESLGLCTVSDSQLLALFRRAVAEMFAINGDSELNFMIKRSPIEVVEGTETYILPRDFKSKIGLWAAKDRKRVELLYRPRTSWMNEQADNIWTTEGGHILVYLPKREQRDSCGHCGHCDPCQTLKSYILTLEYYSYPPMIQDLDEALCWLKNNNDIWNYLVEAMMEQLYTSQAKSYNSPSKTFYRNQLLKWDQDLNPVDERVKTNRLSLQITKY
jgi:hypothetical protein